MASPTTPPTAPRTDRRHTEPSDPLDALVAPPPALMTRVALSVLVLLAVTGLALVWRSGAFATDLEAGGTSSGASPRYGVDVDGTSVLGLYVANHSRHSYELTTARADLPGLEVISVELSTSAHRAAGGDPAPPSAPDGWMTSSALPAILAPDEARYLVIRHQLPTCAIDRPTSPSDDDNDDGSELASTGRGSVSVRLAGTGWWPTLNRWWDLEAPDDTVVEALRTACGSTNG